MKTKHRSAARGKQRRKYEADPMIGMHLIYRTKPLTPSEILHEMMPVYDAMRDIDAATDTEDSHARLLAVACGVRERGLQIDPEMGGVAGDRAVEACVNAFRRLRQRGRFGFAGMEREHMNNAIQLWHDMLTESQPHETEKAARKAAAYARIVCGRIQSEIEQEAA